MIALALWACSPSEDPQPVETGWQVVWEDAFDGADGAPPDPTKWSHELGGGGWGNDELQVYTDSTENSRISNGRLQIRARQESTDEGEYTSARLITQDKFEFTHGKIDAWVRVPEGKGLWPAVWMLGANFDEVGWPSCGEIDLLEVRGSDVWTANAALHGPGYSGGDCLYDHTTARDTSLAESYHQHTVEWDPQHIVWKLDGQIYHQVRAGDVPSWGPWVFESPFFLIVNLAVGGHYDGDPDAGTAFPASLWIDTIRVSQRIDAQ